MGVRARHARLGVAAIGTIGIMLAAEPALARDRHPIQLLSRNAAGGVPNAPAFDPAISGDGRVSRYAAFASAATDIVAGTDGHENVYLVQRARPWGENGTPWRVGPTRLVSQGLGGQPADGDSYDPSFDGYDDATSRCMAFVSAASNLVRGDRNGHADVFVKRLPDGALHRIPTKGAATEVSMDGRCWDVAFVAGGTVYLADVASNGGARRVSERGGAGSPHISVNGRWVTYARNGFVYRDRDRIAPGTNPWPDGYGHNIAFARADGIFRAQQTGAPRMRRVVARGAQPSMTVGGSFVFYVSGPFVRNPVYRTTMGTCPSGEAQQPAGSPHGNYDVFACSGGGAYLHYVGPK
jgi:hypothetical protein